jgi:integrase
MGSCGDLLAGNGQHGRKVRRVLKAGERFGMHSLRHSLATYSVSQGKDPMAVQCLLRHSNVHMALHLYAHGRSQDRLGAQGDILTAFCRPFATVL